MARRNTWTLVAASIAVIAIIGACAVAGVYASIGVRNQRWLDAAENAYRKQDWEQVRINLSRYLPQEPDNVELLMRYAEASGHILENRPSALQDVAQAYHQVLRAGPDNRSIRDALLALYTRQGAWDVLEYHVSEWLRADPDNSALRYELARALDGAGSRDKAIEAYRDLLVREPAFTRVYDRLAALLFERGLNADADATIAQALELHEYDANVQLAAAQHFLRKGDPTTARTHLALTAENAPDDVQVLLAQARMATLDGDLKRAIASAERATASVEPEAFLTLATLLVAANEPEEAAEMLADLDDTTRLDNPRLQIMLIDTFYGLNRTEDADAAAAVYRAAYPMDTATISFLAGRKALAEGDAGEAVKQLAVATEMRPAFQAARLALCVAYLAIGQRDAARNALEAYRRDYSEDLRGRTLWMEHFGEATSLADAANLAAGALQSGDANAPRLVAMAAALSDAASREGVLADETGAVRALLARAIDISPADPEAHSMLAGMMLDAGDTDAARQTLENALALGVDATVLAPTSGRLLLTEGRGDEAWQLFESNVNAREPVANADESSSVDWYRRWSRVFVSANDIDRARLALERGLVSASESRRGELTIDRAMLASQYDTPEAAWTALDEAEAVISSEQASRDTANQLRLLVALRCAEVQDEANLARLTALRDRIALSNEAFPTLPLLDAMLALRANPPNYDEAEVALRAAEANAPRDPLVLDRLRAFYQGRGQTASALGYAERALAAAPGNEGLRVRLGELQVAMGRNAEAVRTLRTLVDTSDNSGALRYFAEALIASEQLAEAEAALDRYESLSGSDSELAASLRSRLLVARGAHVEAESLLRARLEEEPGNTETLWQLAICLRATGRDSEGVALLEQAGAWPLLAQFLSKGPEPDLDAAARAAMRALLDDPLDAAALLNLVEIRELQGDLAAALAACRRYLEIEPRDAAMWHRRALLEMSAGGRWTDALDAANQAVSLDPQATYRALRGYLRTATGDFTGAIADLESANADLPATSAQLDATLAEAYLRTGRTELSRRFLGSATRKADRGEPVNRAVLSSIATELDALEQ